MMELRAHFEEVRYYFSLPTITEGAVGRHHFLNSLEIGIDKVGTRHNFHPTFYCGIVTLRYGLPYDTCVWTQSANFGCTHGVDGGDAFQKGFFGRSVSRQSMTNVLIIEKSPH